MSSKIVSAAPTSTATTSVINVKVENLRPRYNNLQQWLEADPTKHVYIGRPGVVFIDGKRFPPPSLTSSKLFGNPFKIGTNGSREKVISEYRRYALERMNFDDEYRRGVFGLKGKTLGCWCAPLGCHGDVLKEIAETMNEAEFTGAAATSVPAGSIRARENDCDDEVGEEKTTKKKTEAK